MCLYIKLKVDLHLLLKMHFVVQNYGLSAKDVLRPCVDVMHYGPRAQIIHGQKEAHMHVL